MLAFAASALLTGVIRRVAARRGVLDVPNARSSHQHPTPRGGGLAIVLVATLALVILTVRRFLPSNLSLALLGGGLAVAAVGYVDDHCPLRPLTRLTVHFAAALWALACLGGLPLLMVGDHVISLGWAGYLMGAVGIVWVLNLFNFMDGIDGIAASEAIFVLLGGALLSGGMGGGAGVASAAVVVAGACTGFLAWNWPPAKIFMGDVGSGYLGYVIAILGLTAARDKPAAIWVWLLLGSVFFVDATVTLTRRLIRAERVSEAHRSHAYQWLARRWGSHRRVTITLAAINLLLLLPLGLLAASHPAVAFWVVLCVLVAGTLVALAAGSGRRELLR